MLLTGGDSPGHRFAQGPAAGSRLADGCHEFVVAGRLRDVAGRTGVERGDRVGCVIGGGEHQGAGLRRELLQPGERGEAIEPPHRQVEENEIRGEPATGFDRLVTAGRDAGNLEVGLPSERLGETFEKHGMVIDQQ